MKRQYKNRKTDIIILAIRGLKTKEIAQKLDCSYSAVQYHVQRNYKKQAKNWRKSNSILVTIYKRITSFKEEFENRPAQISTKKNYKLISQRIAVFSRSTNGSKRMFSTRDFIDKFTMNPKCGLTGRSIDINQPETWELDHIVPKSRGGDNSLDNCQVLSKEVNQSKGSMTEKEFLSLCKEVLEHHGYNITNPL